MDMIFHPHKDHLKRIMRIVYLQLLNNSTPMIFARLRSQAAAIGPPTLPNPHTAIVFFDKSKLFLFCFNIIMKFLNLVI